MVGMRYESQNYGTMEVIAKERGNRWKVRFMQTGTEVIAESNNIKTGLVKDRYYPTVAGKGYLGGSSSVKNPQIHARWKRMMLACYDQFHLDYPSNAEKKVFVAEEWHNYENYEKDILNLLEKNGFPEKYQIRRIGPSFSLNNISLLIKNR